jgi:arginyl-tRNA--protein-N-Asp/Glu arginylyltransferase
MSLSQTLPKIYISMPHECGYLPDQVATTIFVDPRANIGNSVYSLLARQGFRRSGNLIYRPHCETCNACIPVRIPVSSFKPNRSQRRIAKRNEDLLIVEVEAGYRDEHFELYCRYQNQRHSGSSMDTDDPERYRDFLFGSVGDTRLIEMRSQDNVGTGGKLMAVAVVDELDDGLSAVYTFFEPSESRRALGVYAVLQEIEMTQTEGKANLYLGYYIAESSKMNYKTNYQPLEAFEDGQWTQLVIDGTQ